jgi:hypothetical protein
LTLYQNGAVAASYNVARLLEQRFVVLCTVPKLHDTNQPSRLKVLVEGLMFAKSGDAYAAQRLIFDLFKKEQRTSLGKFGQRQDGSSTARRNRLARRSPASPFA